MNTKRLDRLQPQFAVACSHNASAPYVEVAVNRHNKPLRRHNCGLCSHGWWECDGDALSAPEALRMIADVSRRPQPQLGQDHRVKPGSPGRCPAPAAPRSRRDKTTSPLLPLLRMVGQAIGAEVVFYAPAGPDGWRMIGSVESGTARDLHGGSHLRHSECSVPGDALEYEDVFTSLLLLRQPADLTSGALGEAFPNLVQAGVGRVALAPVVASTGEVTAVILAVYSRCPVAQLLNGGRNPAGVSLETIASMGKLLDNAYRLMRAHGPVPTGALRRRAIPSSVQPEPREHLMLSRDVATLFGVTARTVGNWAAGGALASRRTAGGNLRFERGDVVALYETADHLPALSIEEAS